MIRKQPSSVGLENVKCPSQGFASYTLKPSNVESMALSKVVLGGDIFFIKNVYVGIV